VFPFAVKRPSLVAPLAMWALLTGALVTACGDDDGSTPVEAAVTSTIQDTESNPAGSEGESSDTTSGAGGTATVTVSAGTYELQLDEPCVISEVGIGAVATSDEATLSIAGPQEIAVVAFELSSGDAWFAAAAEVVIEANTMSYSGPAMGPGSDATITVQVFCADTITGPGG